MFRLLLAVAFAAAAAAALSAAGAEATAVLSAPAGAETAAPTRCDAAFHASLITLHCPQFASGFPGRVCCAAVLLAANQGGVPCLCKVAARPRMLVSGVSADTLMTWYRRCRGERTATVGGEAATCSAPSPPARSAASPPPPPSSAAGSTEMETTQTAKENHLLAAVTQPVATTQYVSTEQGWPWYGWVILIAVAGGFLFAAVALCACVGQRCVGRLGPMLYWGLDLIMRLATRNQNAPGAEQRPQALDREPPRLGPFRPREPPRIPSWGT